MDTEEEIEAYRKSVKNDPFWCAMYRHIKLTDKIDSLIVKAQQLQLEYVDATKKEFSEVEFEAKIAKRLKKVNLKELLLKMNC
ncbi:MAG: hypothetical protein GY714_01990 [Desulfobacterales bacterium]|nr:hypothetical protein [Desulfobacterales bacterium]